MKGDIFMMKKQSKIRVLVILIVITVILAIVFGVLFYRNIQYKIFLYLEVPLFFALTCLILVLILRINAKNYIPPYDFDYNEEQKDYRCVGKGNKCKYSNYIEWKTHIESLEISKSIKNDNSTDNKILKNFRRYLIKKMRFAKISLDIELYITIPLMIALIPMILGFDNEENYLSKVICMILVASSFVVMLTYEIINKKTEVDFFEDCIEIFDSMNHNEPMNDIYKKNLS